MEKTEETKNVVAYWEESGLLNDVVDPNDKAVLASNLDRAANDLVIKYSSRYGGTAEVVLFPIICRINKKYGFKPIRAVRELYIDIYNEWEEFIQLESTAEFITEGIVYSETR